MDVKDFLDELGCEFFTGVPDSQLKALCDYLLATYGVNNKHHVIAANEGNAVGIAAGYHLGTGKVPLVYMQNSGEGNAINPITSLLNEHVYAIPCIFVIGWRGEPGVPDEPQHVFQGEITLKLLDVLEIPYFVISKDTVKKDIKMIMGNSFKPLLSEGKQVAFVIRKNAFTTNVSKSLSENNYTLTREGAIRCIVENVKDDLIVCTTGKASRELYEIRESRGEGHDNDFLTVGSMGHASCIALGLALQHPEKRIWIIDGDGSLLMHMGALPVIASCKVNNIVHVIINNGTHESVGGQPNSIDAVNLRECLSSIDYCHAEDKYWLNHNIKNIRSQDKYVLFEIKCNTFSRKDLGRPKESPLNNKEAFMVDLK